MGVRQLTFLGSEYLSALDLQSALRLICEAILVGYVLALEFLACIGEAAWLLLNRFSRYLSSRYTENESTEIDSYGLFYLYLPKGIHWRAVVY